MASSSAQPLLRPAPRGRNTRSGLLPDTAGEFLRRRLAEITGVALIAAAAAMVAALASYHADDPSLNAALPAKLALHPRNLLGLPGSYFSDIFIQTLGLASYLLPLAAIAWGWSLIRHRPAISLWRRLGLMIPALLLTATALAHVRPFGGLPLPATLGGSIGQAILRLATPPVAAAVGPMTPELLTGLAAVGAVLSSTAAMGLG